MKKILFFFSVAITVLVAKPIYVKDSVTTDLEITNKSSVYFVFQEEMYPPDYDEEDVKGLMVTQKAPNEYIITFKKGGEYEKAEGVEEPMLKKVLYSDRASQIFFKGKDTGNKYILRLVPKSNEKELIFEIYPYAEENKIVVLGDGVRIALKDKDGKEFVDPERIITYVKSGDVLKFIDYKDKNFILEDGNSINEDLVQKLSDRKRGFYNSEKTKEIYKIEKENTSTTNLISLNKSAFEIKKSELYEKYKNEDVNIKILETEKYEIVHLVRKTGAKYIQDIYEVTSKIDKLVFSELCLEKFKNLPPNKLKKRLISMKKDLLLNQGEKSLLVIAKER